MSGYNGYDLFKSYYLNKFNFILHIKVGDNLYKYNYPYKIYARDVINELSKSNDEEVISKFIIELCKLSKLKQYKKYNTKRIKCILYNDNKRMK